MQLFDITATAVNNTITAQVQKEIGKLAFYISDDFNNVSQETIYLRVERNGAENIEITKSHFKFKAVALAATYGNDAIGSFSGTVSTPFKTVFIMELSELGNIELQPNDIIKVTLANLRDTVRYVCDGIEVNDTNSDDSDIYIYEDKVLALDQVDVDVTCDNADIMILEDKNEISEVNITHVGGRVTKHSLRELRAMSQDNDALAYVRQDGKAFCSYSEYIQMDVSGIIKINIRKTDTVKVNVLFRKDVMMRQLGLIK